MNPDIKVDGFPSSIHRYNTSRDFNARLAQSRTEAETAAFGYPARALVFKLRVRKSDLWLSATCAVVTASDGLALPSRGGDFRSRSIDDTEEIFWGTPGTAQP